MNLVVFDGHYMLHRMLNTPALKGLSNKDGVHTGALFGCLRALRVTLSMKTVTSVVVVFDAGISKRRREIDPGYKAHRGQSSSDAPVADEENRKYIERFKQSQAYFSYALRKLGGRVVRVNGREGDDLLWLVANLSNTRVIYVSDDRDILQLVSLNGDVFRPIAGEYVTLENFFEKTGYKDPQRFLWGKCIRGDGSDEIPGVRGVGDAVVKDLVNGSSGLDEIAKKCHEDKRKKYRAIAENMDRVRKNLQLIDIKQEVFTDDEIMEVMRILQEPVGVDIPKVRELFVNMEFASFLKEMETWLIPFQRLI